MKSRAYYNEIDRNAAQWIRELIKAGAITDGEVDERSIEDVLPADLAGFQRCHFFAGIACWDYALTCAGWPDDRQVWTGSCPCQPFSAAGKGAGFDDERHLWPAWFHLASVCRPDTIFGEQVASKDGLTWLDLVSSDLEGVAYTIAPIDIPAAGVGAPHIRQRLFFVADSGDNRRRESGNGRQLFNKVSAKRSNQRLQAAVSGTTIALGENAISAGRRGRRDGDSPGDERQIQTEGFSSSGELVNAEHAGLDRPQGNATVESGNGTEGRLSDGTDSFSRELVDSASIRCDGYSNNARKTSRTQNERRLLESSGSSSPSLTNGFWHDAEWIYCTDEKYRPAKSGIFPLAARIAGRVAILRGAGNSINAEVAKEFIKAYLSESAECDGKI